MINALTKALTALVKKPFLVLPALAVAGVAIIVEMLTIETKFLLLFELFFEERIPQVSLIEMPFRLIELYPTEIAILLASFALIVFLNIFVFIIYAKFVKMEKEEKKSSLREATKYAFSKIGQAILLFIVLALIGLFFAVLYFLFIAVLPITSFSWIIFIIIFLLFIYLFIKLLYIIPAFVDAEEAKAFGKRVMRASGGIKQAFGKSWSFTSKHLLGTIALLVVLGLINLVAWTLIANAAELLDVFAAELPELSIAVLYILLSILAAFTNLAICYYYFENK